MTLRIFGGAWRCDVGVTDARARLDLPGEGYGVGLGFLPLSKRQDRGLIWDPMRDQGCRKTTQCCHYDQQTPNRNPLGFSAISAQASDSASLGPRRPR